MANHRIVVKDLDEFGTFVTALQVPDVEAHSLAIAIDPVALNERYNDHDNTLNAAESTKRVWALLEELCGIMPRLKSLHVFSLKILSGRNGFWTPRPLVFNLLSSLPVSCTSVEVDTNSSDYCEPGTAHLCEAIRDILPQLQHLRLGLTTMCATAFQAQQPCPDIKTLVVSCFSYPVTTRLCGSYAEDPVRSALRLGEEAMPHLVQQIQALAPQCPNLSQALMCDQSGKDDEDPASHPSYHRRDVLRDTVTALPLIRIVPFVEDGNMLRTLDGEVFGSFGALKAFLEVDISKQHGAERALPQDQAELTLLGVEEWKAKYPNRSCSLWSHEKRTGTRLLEACEVAGAGSQIGLVETTPEGWERNFAGDLYQE